MNIRTNCANGPAPVAFALGDTNKALPADAAADAETEPFPKSRRVNANAVHINGPATGTSPEPPEANHDHKLAPNPLTAPEPTTGATAATGADAAVLDAACAATAAAVAGA